MIESYIMIILITVTYIFVQAIPCKSKNTIFLFSSFFEIFIILILRTPISDMTIYVKAFDTISTMNINELIGWDWEKGYMLLNKLISLIFNNERFFIIVTSFLGILGPYVFIKRYSKNYLLSLIIYIGLNFLTIQYYLIRQSIALTFIILSIESINKKKVTKFCIYVFIATLFHNSAIVFIIVYILSNININNKILFVLFLITFILKQQIVLVFSKFADYSVYINTTDISGGRNMLILLILCYLIMCSLKCYKIGKETKEEKTLNAMYIISIFFQILALNTSMMARIVMYFSISLVCLLPNYIEEVRNKKLKNIYVYIIFILVFYYTLLLKNTYQYIPFYRS